MEATATLVPGIAPSEGDPVIGLGATTHCDGAVETLAALAFATGLSPEPGLGEISAVQGDPNEASFSDSWDGGLKIDTAAVLGKDTGAGGTVLAGKEAATGDNASALQADFLREALGGPAPAAVAPQDLAKVDSTEEETGLGAEDEEEDSSEEEDEDEDDESSSSSSSSEEEEEEESESSEEEDEDGEDEEDEDESEEEEEEEEEVEATDGAETGDVLLASNPSAGSDKKGAVQKPARKAEKASAASTPGALQTDVGDSKDASCAPPQGESQSSGSGQLGVADWARSAKETQAKLDQLRAEMTSPEITTKFISK